MCNYAWYIITDDGKKYMIKQEKEVKEESEQNDLFVEARTIQKLNIKKPSLPIPQVIFIVENPKMYCYQYAEGIIIRETWQFLSEQERITLCEDLGKFHFDLGYALTQEEIKQLRLKIDEAYHLEEETQEDIERFLADTTIDIEYKNVVATIYQTYQQTMQFVHLGLCHNDSHYENILVHHGKLSCVVDFGDTDFGDVHREFTRYFQDYPDYYELIVQTYENLSGRKLSRKRIIAQSILENLDDIPHHYTQDSFLGLWEKYTLT